MKLPYTRRYGFIHYTAHTVLCGSHYCTVESGVKCKERYHIQKGREVLLAKVLTPGVENPECLNKVLEDIVEF